MAISSDLEIGDIVKSQKTGQENDKEVSPFTDQESFNERVRRRISNIFFNFNNTPPHLMQLKHVQSQSLAVIKAPPLRIPRYERAQPQLRVLVYQPEPLPSQQTELETYFDEEFRAYYFVPRFFSEVNRFLESVQVEGGYCGLSCGRMVKIKNLTKGDSPKERCDIIVLTKNPHQVKYKDEPPTHRLSFIESWINFPITKTVSKWQANQAKAYARLMKELPEKIKEWKYDTFMVIAEEKDLLALGYAEEVAKKIHLLALFYKRVSMQP